MLVEDSRPRLFRLTRGQPTADEDREPDGDRRQPEAVSAAHHFMVSRLKRANATGAYGAMQAPAAVSDGGNNGLRGRSTDCARAPGRRRGDHVRVARGEAARL